MFTVIRNNLLFKTIYQLLKNDFHLHFGQEIFLKIPKRNAHFINRVIDLYFAFFKMASRGLMIKYASFLVLKCVGSIAIGKHISLIKLSKFKKQKNYV